MPLAPSESEAIGRRVDSALSADLPGIPWRCRTEIQFFDRSNKRNLSLTTA